MSFSPDREKIRAVLDEWLRSPGVGNSLKRVLSGHRPTGPSASFFIEAPRLIMVLKGRATFLTVEEDREVRFDMLPGQLLFLAPYTWISPVPHEPYSSLGITFRSDSTRIIITSRRAMTKKGRVTDHYEAQWRTLETLAAKGEHLIQLIRGSAPERMGDRMYSMVAEILVSEVAALVDSASEHIRPGQTVLWQMVSDYLAEHWSDPQLSRKSVASHFNRHPNHISRFFHLHAKMNFRTYVNEIRLERSIQFLRNLRYNVTDVAALCGFADVPYFIHLFRTRFGVTPGEYRKRYES